MNKLLTKIASAVAGLAMVVGVSFAVASNKANKVEAVAGDTLYSSGEFSTVSTHSYTQNKTFTLSGKSWTASVSQVNGEVFYLGCNSNNASKGVLGNNATFSDVNTALIAEDDQYTTGTTHAYALLFNNAYNDVGEVTFVWNGGNNAFQIYLFGDTGSGFALLNKTNYASSGAAVSGSVSWSSDGAPVNYTRFAIVARPGTTSSTATNKTLRPGTFIIKEGASGTYYTVSFDSNGGSAVSSQPVADSGSAKASEPIAPTKDGYSFVGWYLNAQGTGDPYDFDTPVTGDLTLYAKWVKVDPTESYSPSLTNNSKHRLIGEVTAITGDEYFFIQNGNNVMQINGSVSSFNVATGNTVDLFGTYKSASFKIDTLVYCDVTANDNVISQEPITSLTNVTSANRFKYCEISQIKLSSAFSSKTANINGSNVKLYYNSASYVNGGTFNPSDYLQNDYVAVKGVVQLYNETVEIYITSIEKEQVHTVTFNLNAASGVTPIADQAVVHGGNAVAPSPAPTRDPDETYNYTFVGWYLNAEGTGDQYDFSTPVNADLTLYAKWNSSLIPAKQVVATKTTNASVAYSEYEKHGVGALDTLDRALTGVTGTSYTDWTSSSESGISYKGNSAGGNSSIQLRTSGSTSGVIVTANTNNYNASTIEIEWNTNTAGGRAVNIYGKNEAYAAASDLYNNTKQGTLLGTLAFNNRDVNNKTVLNITGSYKYIGFRSSDSPLYLTSVDIQWGEPTTFTYTNLGIRFGASISEELWNRLETESDIQGYGMFLSTPEYLGSDTIKNFYDLALDVVGNSKDALEQTADGTNIKWFSNEHTDHDIALKETPTLLANGNYVWNLYKKISFANAAKNYVAVAYIKIANEVIFLDQITANMKDLAQDLIDNDPNYDAQSLGGSLSYLANA